MADEPSQFPLVLQQIHQVERHDRGADNQIGHGQADDVEVPDGVEAFLPLHSVEDEQVHHDREEGEESQTDPEQDAMEVAVEGQRVIAPRGVSIEEVTPAVDAEVDGGAGVEVRRV